MGAEAVNPEFLAALPPSIQEEVLAQQRHLQAAQGHFYHLFKFVVIDYTIKILFKF